MPLISTNPAQNYETLGEVEISTEAEIQSKVQLAHEAQKKWWKMGLDARITHLRKLEDIFKAHREELIQAPIVEAGVTRDLSTGLADSAEESFAWNLDHAHEALATENLHEDDSTITEAVYEPYGVGAAIVPWNFLYPSVNHTVIQPLLAGNTMVMKYSEETPLFGKLIEELVEEAGLPEGVLTFVHGDGQVGAQLVDQDINFICFTGSYVTGQKLYEKAAEKFIPIINELGGSSPGIVFDDADVDAIVEDIFWARFLNTAQFCDGLKRLIVHESIADELTEKLIKFTESKVVGNPQDEGTELGPLIAERQVVKLEGQLEDAVNKGANILCGGKRPEGVKGAYFELTLLNNIKPDMDIWHDEVFGPILPIVTFRTYDEAIRMANDNIYGLSAYIYTKDKELANKAISDLESGTISVHGANPYGPHSPFGGYKCSGLGRTGGIRGFRDVAQLKTVARIK